MRAFREKQRREGVRRVNLTLSASEYEALAESAKRFEETVTRHAHTLLFGVLEKKSSPPPDLAEKLDATIAILRGIGNNINQLSRHANQMRYFVETNEVHLQLRRLEEEIRHLIRRYDY